MTLSNIFQCYKRGLSTLFSTTLAIADRLEFSNYVYVGRTVNTVATSAHAWEPAGNNYVGNVWKEVHLVSHRRVLCLLKIYGCDTRRNSNVLMIRYDVNNSSLKLQRERAPLGIDVAIPCFVCLVGFLTSSSTTRLYRGRAPRQERLDNFTCCHT